MISIRPIALLTLLVLVPGCFSARKRRFALSATHNQIRTESTVDHHPDIQEIRLQEAKLVDIALPLSAIPLPDYFDSSSPITMLGYRDTTLSLCELQEYFMQEMARTGWLLKEQVVGSREILFRFKKPTKRCFISLRKERQGVVILLFTGFTQDLEQ